MSDNSTKYQVSADPQSSIEKIFQSLASVLTFTKCIKQSANMKTSLYIV